MGVPGLWTELNDAGYDISLNLLAIQSFNKITTSNNSSSKHPKRALVLGIDVSIWFFHAAQQGKNILRYAQEANKKSESDLTLLPLKILFYRLGMLLAFPVHVLFICDGPGRPVHKRGKNIITTGFSKLQRDFLNLVDAFGFRYRVAPGEAEAELAYLNQTGVVDVVMTDDVDTLLFGAKEVILNWSPTTAANKARRRRQRDSDSEASSSHENEDSDSDPLKRNNRLGKKSTIKDPKDDERISEKLKKSRKETWVTVFNAQEIEDDPLIYLTKEGLILIALLSKGDYTPGVQGFGVRTAVPLAKAGFGKELIENYQKFCQRIPPPTFQLVSNEGNITKSSRPTSSLKHLFKAYPSKKPNDLESAEWRSFLKDWIHRIQHELTTDSKGFFRERDHNKQPKLANSMGLINFMTTSKEIEALDSYIYPVISKDIDKELYEKANSFKGRTTTEDSGSGLGLGGEEIKWKEPDPRLIAKQAQEAFGWNREKTLNKMRNRIWQGMVVRQLRREAMRRDRGETSENSKIPNNRDHENQSFQTPSKPSRYQSNFLSPMTPGSSSSTPSILSNLSPLSSVTTPSGSQHYLNDTTKSVEVPSNQKEAQKFAHENGLAYLLACHSTRKDKEVGNVKEYRLEIDPTGFVKRANADLVDEVENLSEEMKNLQSGDEGDAVGGEGTEKIKKGFEPPLKPLRLWIAQDLLYFDSRGKQLMKELDEKVRKKNIEKEEKEMRKKLGINKKGKKTTSGSSSKSKSKSRLEKGKGKGRSGFTSDEEEDDEIFGSESDDDDGEGDLTVKASNVTSSSNRFKSQPAPKNSTPPYSNVASTSKFKLSSSNPVLNSFQRKNKGSEPITLSDSDDEPNSSNSKPTSKSKPKSKSDAKLPQSSTQSSRLKLPSKHLIFDDDDDDEDDSLPNAYDAIRGIKSSNRKIRNRGPSNPSSEASDLEKSPRKKDKPNRVGSSKSQEKRKVQNQSKSDVDLEDGDDSVVLILNPTASTSTSNNRTLTRNSKDEPIVLSD